jgi:hypothetical protein
MSDPDFQAQFYLMVGESWEKWDLVQAVGGTSFPKTGRVE